VNATCPLCDADAAKGAPSIPGRVKCECGMVYQARSSRVELDGGCWDRLDYAGDTRTEWAYGVRRQKARERLVAKMTCLIGPGRWLDIGCGPGDLLAAAATAGWETAGIDLSRRAVELAKERGISVTCGRFPDDLSAGVYDVISLIYALEYFEDPKSLVRECLHRLKPSGALLLQLKNFAFWRVAERFFRDSSGTWCPADIRSYSPDTAGRLLRLGGFGWPQVLPAELPGRAVANACLGFLSSVSGLVLSPSFTAIARHPGGNSLPV
jgi:SAM-dependent methyltransferase